ncbi:hypothetical protein L1049_006961 [Liquidambar formosana]|uniref:Protein SIEVE ELEMENT OCCLUSION B-like n=1 Tax=Liquidambar formosana TaxID=63359 RepID=A0AAP0WUU1_LIQFO
MGNNSTAPDVQTKELKGAFPSYGLQADKNNVKPLLHIVEYILNRVVASITLGNVEATQARTDAVRNKALHAGFDEMFQLVQPHTKPIHEISCEITCKCSGDGDEHAKNAVLKSLLSYDSCYAKVVIALAAFALNCGKHLLVSQLYPKNPLAKSVAILEQLPHVADTEKPKFCKLIMAMLDVAKCIADFEDLPSQYMTPDTPVMQNITAQYFPKAVEWTIRSIVACVSQIMGHESASKPSSDLSRLTLEGNKYQKYFRDQLEICKKFADNQVDDAYRRLVALINEHGPLKIFTDHKGEQLALFHQSTNTLESIDVLKGKTVFLVISELDFSEKDLTLLVHLYQQSRENESESQTEIVWLPVGDASATGNEKQFETLQAAMPWYSPHFLWSLDPAAIKYIKQVWQFKKLPLVVVLDPLTGKAGDPEDFHMIWTSWAYSCYKEDQIWLKDTVSSIRFLIGSFVERNLTWAPEGKYICFFGGEDIDWIREFTNTAREVAQAANFQLEMLYVGKKDPSEKFKENNAIIVEENLGRTVSDLIGIQFFWLRLQSILLSNEKQGKRMDNNLVMRVIAAMLSFNSSNQGWAVISNESSRVGETFEVTKAKGDTILKCLKEYNSWMLSAVKRGFLSALNKHHYEHHTSKHCNHMILPMTGRSTDMVVTCVECDRPMKKFISYRCCDD